MHVELDKLGEKNGDEGQLEVEAELEDILGGRPKNSDGTPMLSGYFGTLLPALFIDGKAQRGDGTEGTALHFWLQEAVAEDPIVLCSEPDPVKGLVGSAPLDARIQQLVARAA